MSCRRWGSVTIHCHGLSAWWIRALLTFAPTRAPQEGHCPFHEVASTVLRQGMSWGSGVGWRKGYAAAVLICWVRVEVRGVLIVVMGRSVDSLGPGDMAWGDIRAGRGGCLVEVWWSRVTVTTEGSGCSRILITNCSCHRGPAHSRTALLFLAWALGQAVRPSRTTRGSWGTASAATCLAFL